MAFSYYTAVGLGDNGPEVDAPLRFNVGMFAKRVAITASAIAGLVALGHYTLDSAPVSTNLVVSPNAVQGPAAVRASAAVARPRTVLPDIDAQEVPEAAAVSADAEKWNNAMPIAMTTAMVHAMGPIEQAGAAEIYKGRTASLIHPASMFAMLAISCYAAWLGFQWRRARTIGQEINELKAQVTTMAQKLSTGKLEGTAKEMLAALKGDDSGKGSIQGDIAVLQGIVPVEAQVAELTAERKILVGGNYRDKHFATGSAILAVGVTSAILAPVNTYLRVGKLFPGPHLYVGAAMTAMWAVAAGLVPAMQKGNETARSVHIALNVVNTGFFAWQVWTGIPILLKVLKFTNWP
jgi:hypothetical protein|eukprot:CAMPEP_0174284394 /NCGR_PEP_ID=MMETSP0809-20121228/5289_1 /TAXON_ID=73025 ORGANISM="Eutreptiella gymnastica-like, Strain CCMP1594" /NCGR_SAMPLE_ID=MMETSP0809 /ASSEMBLY_ACC=CAM_ASM_000658 /LENGTH=349 /DNA_ID=CAMNT_0015379883 /DNA_START=32 /DNA_END=1081 /DNA_ORIENTATION=-